jgi:hypothetical protein
MPSRVDALKSLALFASSRRKDLDVIARYLDEMSFVQGATLINQGQSNHTFFAIADGDASVSISGEPRRTLASRRLLRRDQHAAPHAGDGHDRGRHTAAGVCEGHEQFGALSTSPDVVTRLQAAIGKGRRRHMARVRRRASICYSLPDRHGLTKAMGLLHVPSDSEGNVFGTMHNDPSAK